jgi:hypothetical protein
MLGLAGNEESRWRRFGRKWWVMVGSAVVDECHCRRGEGEEEEKKKKKKTRGVRGCFVLILVCVFFLEMMRCQLMSGGQKTLPFCIDRIAVALNN